MLLNEKHTIYFASPNVVNHYEENTICDLTLYPIITPLKYHVFENIMFSKVFKTKLKFFMNFFNVV